MSCSIAGATHSAFALTRTSTIRARTQSNTKLQLRHSVLILCTRRVAILFILEIDDVFFAMWIPDATKVRIEKFRNSVPELGDEEALLTTTKQAHTVLLSFAIVIPILTAAILSVVAEESVKMGERLAMFTPFVAVYIGGLLEMKVTKQNIRVIIAGAVTGLAWLTCVFAAQHLKKTLLFGDKPWA